MADLVVDTAKTIRAKIQHTFFDPGLAERFPCLPVSWPRASPQTIKQKTGLATYGFHYVEPPFFGWIAAPSRPP